VELTVEFVVTDARTGEPVPGAEVSVFNEYLRRAENGAQGEEFTLRTDESGRAHRVSPECRASGRSNRLMPFRNTYGFSAPKWHILSTGAPGYAPTEPVFLSDVPGVTRSGRSGEMQARMVVPIALEPLP
jgi:hypothetical protein